MFECVILSKGLADSITAALSCWERKHPGVKPTHLYVPVGRVEEAELIVPGMIVACRTFMAGKVGAGLMPIPDPMEVGR